MQLYNDRKRKVGIVEGYKNRCIVETLSTGDKELTFEYPTNGVHVSDIKEEAYLRTKTDEFVIKAVEKGEDYNKYTAALNIEELENKIFEKGFESSTETMGTCLAKAFEGTGWGVICVATKKRTIRIQECTTAWDVLKSCLSTYRCECIIDSINKKVTIAEKIGQDRGCYFIEGLNLKKLGATSDTYEFFTRIIPIGKDGLTIEELEGKEYLENFQYSTKVKTYIWKDERYTHPESLREDAEAKLEELSKPRTVYSADIIDLAKESKKYKNILEYGIGDTVTIVSKTTGVKEKQRIVRIEKYPENPEKNTAELSNTNQSYVELQASEVEEAKETAVQISEAELKEYSQEVEEEFAEVNESIGEMQVSFGKTESGLLAEVIRAQGAENELAGRFELTAEQINMEIARAMGAEESIRAGIQLAEGEITQEVERAKGAEDVIKASLSLKIDKLDNGQIISMINGAADRINFNANNLFTVNSPNFTVDEAGRITMVEADISGKVTAKTGKIGPFTVGDYDIYGTALYNSRGTALWEDSVMTDTLRVATIVADKSKISIVGNVEISDSARNLTIWNSIKAPGIRNRSSTATANIRLQDGDAGWLAEITSSSERYKHDISNISQFDLLPERLYNLPPRQYIYNENYLDCLDQRYEKFVCGFIAEEMHKHYPIATEYDQYGRPENWNERYIIPPMLALIQAQHKEIETMKLQNLSRDMDLILLKKEMEEMKDA